MNSKYIVLDLETDGLNWRKDEVIAVGFKEHNKEAESVHILQIPQILNYILEGIFFERNYKLLIGHNITFDLLFIWNRDELHDWFRSGGKIWDTQLVEYMITGHQSRYSKLRDIAVNKYGCKDRIKWIDRLLFEKSASKEINDYQKVSDLPEEKVLIDVMGDVCDTEQVYLQQLKEVERLGMSKLIELQMDALLATTEMQYNGMKINREVLIDNKLHLEQQLEEKEKELSQLVSKHWR